MRRQTDGPAIGMSGLEQHSDGATPLLNATGFPSPAEEVVEPSLNLNEYLVEHPASTFFVRVSGDAMSDSGIRSGDVLVVDRSKRPADGNIVIVALDGELVARRLRRSGNQICLVADSLDALPIMVAKQQRFEVWGVATWSIHRLI